MLDIFDNAQMHARDYARRHLAEDLPLTFDEGFDVSWRHGMVFGNSVAEWKARHEAIKAYTDDVYARTGARVELVPSIEDVGVIDELGGAAPTDTLSFVNKQIAGILQKNPNSGIKELTQDEWDRRTLGISREARKRAALAAGREKTLGGSIGFRLAGPLAAGAVDPINLITFPLAAPRAYGWLKTALSFSAIAAGTQTAIEAVGLPYREKVEPGYAESGEPLKNVAAASAFGFAIGGALKGLANGYRAIRARNLGQDVRDAGNVTLSEEQIANTNRLTGVEGEVAHREALADTLDKIVQDRPTDVSQWIDPEKFDARLEPVMDARARALGAGEKAHIFERNEARLPDTMERLSERQLSEFRDLRDAADIDSQRLADRIEGESLRVVKQRERLDNTSIKIESDRQDVFKLKTEIDELTARRDELIDQESVRRLEAVEQDLARTDLPAARRAEIEVERAQIQETLQKTLDEQLSHKASLSQELEGLNIAFKRQSKRLSRREKTLQDRERSIRARESDITARERRRMESRKGKVDVAEKSLRRSLMSLAKEGYGIELPATDADELMKLIMAATREELDKVLREVTESFVTRKVNARRTLGDTGERPLEGQTPRARELKNQEFHTDQLRRELQRTSRDLGFDLPAEDALTIARRLLDLDDDQALRVLDEFMLRPRTLADTLPGASPVGRATPTERPPTTGSAQEAALQAPNSQEIRESLTPDAAAKLRLDDEVNDQVFEDLRVLLEEREDLNVPVGETITADGKRTLETKSFRDIFRGIEQRDKQIALIKNCVEGKETE